MVAILLPSDVEARIHDEFQQILSEYAVIREQEVKKELTPEENMRLGRKIAEFLISSKLLKILSSERPSGGEKIAWGVQTVSVKVASKVEDRGEKYVVLYNWEKRFSFLDIAVILRKQKLLWILIPPLREAFYTCTRVAKLLPNAPVSFVSLFCLNKTWVDRCSW